MPPPTSRADLQKQQETLRAKLENASSEEEKIKYQTMLAGLKAREDYSAGINLAREALEKAKATRQDELIARTYFGCGNIHFRNNRMDEALADFKAGMAFAENYGDPELRVNFNNMLGKIYKQMGIYEKALGYLQQALSLLKPKTGLPGYNTRMSSLHNNLANLFYCTQNLPAAVDQSREAIRYARLVERWDMVSGNFHMLAQTYERMGEHELAADAYQQAADYNDKVKKKVTSPNGKRSHDN
jgi:tetratricopeptide (TPR) repeat protein